MMIQPPLSLYIHLPWCVRKCPYCDFNSHALRSGIPERRYVKALLADLEQDLHWHQNPSLVSIFVGGGTPSLFSPESLNDLLNGIRQRAPCGQDIEITLEANPGTVEAGRFREFRDLGINRLSLGIQSFQDAKLSALGRIHRGSEALNAIESAQKSGFTNLNLDLMFGLPGQNPADALYDLRTAISQNPTHISYYQLTLEPNTLFAKYPPPLPPDDEIWEIQRRCHAVLEESGFHQYEISAFARRGHPCRHNLNYWRFGDYLGIGAGAHGKITTPSKGKIHRQWKLRHPMHYMDKAADDSRTGGRQEVSPSERPLEFLMNTLRLREGFGRKQFESHTGLPFSTIEETVTDLCGEGLLVDGAHGFHCSDKGWLFLDSILERFTAS